MSKYLYLRIKVLNDLSIQKFVIKSIKYVYQRHYEQYESDFYLSHIIILCYFKYGGT